MAGIGKSEGEHSSPDFQNGKARKQGSLIASVALCYRNICIFTPVSALALKSRGDTESRIVITPMRHGPVHT
jgi:hypothetical protein